MSERGKINAVLLLQLATFAGLAFAYWKVAPLLDKANETLDKANEIENRISRII